MTFKESLLIGYIKFLGEHGAADGELEKWNLVLNKLLTNKNSDSQGMNTQDSAISLVEDNDTLAKTDYTDEFDIMSEMEIFTRLKGFNFKFNMCRCCSSRHGKK